MRYASLLLRLLCGVHIAVGTGKKRAAPRSGCAKACAQPALDCALAAAPHTRQAQVIPVASITRIAAMASRCDAPDRCMVAFGLRAL